MLMQLRNKVVAFRKHLMYFSIDLRRLDHQMFA